MPSAAACRSSPRLPASDSREARRPLGCLHRRQRLVEVPDAIGQVLHQRHRQPAIARHPIEQQVLIEAPHRDDPVDGLAVAVETEPAVVSARDLVEGQIDVGRGPAIDGELGAAGALAQCQGREIEIGEPDRALELEGPLARKEHRRTMGIDALDRRAWRQAIACRVGEKIDGGLLRLGHRHLSYGRSEPGRPCHPS